MGIINQAQIELLKLSTNIMVIIKHKNKIPICSSYPKQNGDKLIKHKVIQSFELLKLSENIMAITFLSQKNTQNWVIQDTKS